MKLRFGILKWIPLKAEHLPSFRKHTGLHSVRKTTQVQTCPLENSTYWSPKPKIIYPRDGHFHSNLFWSELEFLRSLKGPYCDRFLQKYFPGMTQWYSGSSCNLGAGIHYGSQSEFCLVYSWSSSLMLHLVEQQKTAQVLGHSHSRGRHGWSSWLLASPWSTLLAVTIWSVYQGDEVSFSLSLPLHLPLQFFLPHCNSAFQRKLKLNKSILPGLCSFSNQALFLFWSKRTECYLTRFLQHLSTNLDEVRLRNFKGSLMAKCSHFCQIQTLQPKSHVIGDGAGSWRW